MQPHFTGTALITDDVPDLGVFYATVLEADVEGGDPFARVTVPGAVLSFFSTQGMEAMVPGSTAAAARGGFTLEFRVTDVDARHERLSAQGVEILKPPTTQPWGRRSVWLRDPDGNIVNLYQET
ncbi:VOC family protein [Streptomyces camelliae]|uniref:VOC family protein n=1 Tax=Streptomyces camelliae TaxID=3004093 RepID=A0ABY7NVU8_9ACTN|nr:VOC family protein [Streptomyces sp. HUAS 2-6]WBO61919.1 VOC family protein [Streptomyces sp. HUAS 2-6]